MTSKRLAPGMVQPGTAKPTSREAPSRMAPQIGTEVPPSVGDNQPDNMPTPDLAQQRIDFRIEDFIRVIKQHGQRVLWRKAMLCTCQNPETNQAILTCTLCRGTGTRYVAPLMVQAIFQQHDAKTKIYEKFGTWMQSTAQVTIEAQYRLAYHDSLEMLDALASFYEGITKGDRSNYRRDLPPNRDVARYRIKYMTHMIALPPRSSLGVQRAEILPEQGIHYRIVDGQIEWLDRGREIPDGSYLSIRYDYSPVYLVLHALHQTRNDVNATRAPGMTLRAFPLTGGVQLDFAFDATKDADGNTIGATRPPLATTGDVCACEAS